MRRGPGLAALDRSAHSSASYQSLGSDLSTASLAELTVQLDSFSSSLRSFATRHRHDILRDASFRHSFQQMCSKLGVDPLADIGGSSRGGGGSRSGKLWEAVGLGDWTYALAVQVVDICVSSRSLNGGLLEMQDLCNAVTRIRTGTTVQSISTSSGTSNLASSGAAAVTVEDVLRALKTLQPLGCGYEVLTLGGSLYVRTLPQALDPSTTVLLSLLSAASTSKDGCSPGARDAASIPRDVQGTPYLTAQSLQSAMPSLGKQETWTIDRAETALRNATQREGLLWVDQGIWPHRYYSLAIGTSTSASSIQLGMTAKAP
ncbi:RNA polymerase II transcription factor complex subunit [Ceraceosorus bombacis]|uniref:RNA polymerase II transcription factor complex subunit n=1 Tax=Ceraceosorus bombacis TaxID=401625 RepID=A0A0P1BN28_9BASI|nr:RNA polymerase II transcription factor complex subunit [Ceraceosorus bombacis]